MGIVTGYLTNPNLSEADFREKVGDFKRLGLETKLFKEGLRRGNSIGPNGILLSGNVNLNSSDIMKIMYGSNLQNNVKGLTYDVSSSQGGEDFEVRKLDFRDFDSYFALRVGIDDESKILAFNKDYLEAETGFRYVEPGYVAYEYLVNSDNFDSKFEEAKQVLLKEKFKLNDKETTIIKGLI